MKLFTLPDLGEGLADAEIVEWHIEVGSKVETDQVVLTVETAKALVEVPSPCTGTIAKRHGKEGDILDIGTLLLEIEDGVTASQEVKKEQAATVVGNVSNASHNVNVDEYWVGGNHISQNKNLITAMPAARNLAQKLGVDINEISGSGPNGAILEQDVYNQCDKQLPGTEVLKGARRTMASSMAQSHHDIAAVTITEEAELSSWKKGEDVTCRIVKAIVDACQKEPALNAWFDSDTLTRCMHSAVNIGVAVDSKHGLYVPVLRHANDYSPKDVRKWLDTTVSGIRERRIGRDQLQNATITLTNFGAIAGLYATPVVTAPQVAIVGVGRMVSKLIMLKGKVTEIKALPISITFDHRACTGGEAARFIKTLVQSLQAKE